MNDIFYNTLNYYKIVSIAKKMVEQNMLTNQECTYILEKLKQYYKIK